MDAVGVKRLSSAVTIQIVECTDPSLDQEATERLRQRWPLIRRVFASIVTESRAALSPPELWGCDELVVLHRVSSLSSNPEAVPVLLSDDRTRIYFRRDRQNLQGSLARELAFGFYPDSTAGPIAAAIKEVLLATDVEEARLGLNDLGFSEIELAHQLEANQPGIGPGGSENGEVYPTVEIPPPPEEELPEISAVEDAHKGAGRSTKRPSQTQRTMLRSYVANLESDNTKGMSEEAKWHRLETDRNGIDYVLSHERRELRHPTEMPHTNEGYDIESRNDAGEIVRFIEVKSISGPWEGYGIPLTAPEFRMAQERRGLYWLYVVENVSSAEPTLHMIQDPASKVVEFRFDDGWRVAAEIAATSPRRSLRDVIKHRLHSEENEETLTDEDEPLVS
jgi:hypothetical protein